MNCLISWLGFLDFEKKIGIKNKMAPLEALLNSVSFDFQKIIVLDDQQNPKEEWEYSTFKSYINALKHAFPYKEIKSYQTEKFNAADINEVYRVTQTTLTKLYKEGYINNDDDLSFNTTSGTDIMKVCWTLLSIAQFRADLLQSWYDKKNDTTKCEKYVIPIELDINLSRMKENLENNEKSYLDLDSNINSNGFIPILHDPEIMKIDTTIDKLTCYDSVNVLILGETGSGKGFFAEQIAKKTNNRKGKYIEFNISAISESLIESELFGHVRGSFTGAVMDKTGLIESADKGTLFIDEIGDLPESSQVKLLRAIQEKKIKKVGAVEDIEVDIRIISATHSAQKLRPDLYYRLADVVINIPPLRKRYDIIEIAENILKKCNEDFKKSNKSYVEKILSDDGGHYIKSLPWPGNIRELQFVIKRCCFNSDDKEITKNVLMQNIFQQFSNSTNMDVLHFPIKENLEIIIDNNIKKLELKDEIVKIKNALDIKLNQIFPSVSKKAAFLGITASAVSQKKQSKKARKLKV